MRSWSNQRGFEAQGRPAFVSFRVCVCCVLCVVLSVLHFLDKKKIAHNQEQFLHEIGVTTAQTFLNYNFAPTELRRNIAILGLLHKRVLGLCHPSFERLLPWYTQRFETGRGFGHNKQLYGQWLESTQQTALFNKSVFCMVDIYNNLPQYVVDGFYFSDF